VAKGPNRGQPLTPAGLRTIFRYHRGKAGVPAGHPHALRHSFGTALAEAGVDLAVLQALMGHDHVDSSAAYIKPRVFASAGQETAGRVISAGRIETSARHSCSLVTRDYATLIPSGARNNHQEGKINDGPTRR
jgi:hypothetical protein